jgi:site-specific recombinase XerD
VQEKLRHVNLDTTALYTHVTNNKLSEITQWLTII